MEDFVTLHGDDLEAVRDLVTFFRDCDISFYDADHADVLAALLDRVEELKVYQRLGCKTAE